MMHVRIGDDGLRRRAKWIFALAVAFVALGAWLQHTAAAQPEGDLDWRRAPNALSASLEASEAPEGEAVFEWRFDARAAGVACSLDADGDGELDYRLGDCTAQRQVIHRFREGDQGVYFATLLARSADGRTGLARAPVNVR